MEYKIEDEMPQQSISVGVTGITVTEEPAPESIHVGPSGITIDSGHGIIMDLFVLTAVICIIGGAYILKKKIDKHYKDK